DIIDTDYLMGGVTHPAFLVDDSRWTGDVLTQYHVGADPTWRTATTGFSDDVRAADIPTSTVATFSYLTPSSNTQGIRDYRLVEKYELNGDALNWTMAFSNTTTQSLQIGDLGLPMLFNRYWPADQVGIYEQRVFEH